MNHGVWRTRRGVSPHDVTTSWEAFKEFVVERLYPRSDTVLDHLATTAFVLGRCLTHRLGDPWTDPGRDMGTLRVDTGQALIHVN